MAIACLELVTFWPLPDFNLPSSIARISRSTEFEAVELDLRPLVFVVDFFVAEDFFAFAIFFAVDIVSPLGST